MEITPTTARAIAYHVVVDWISRHTNIPQPQIKMNVALDHYGVTEGAYLDMCNQVTATINRACGTAMALSGQWRLDHRSDLIMSFVEAVAEVLESSDSTHVAAAAMNFAAMSIGGPNKDARPSPRAHKKNAANARKSA